MLILKTLSKVLTSIHFFELQIFDLDSIKEFRLSIVLKFGLINSHSIKNGSVISTFLNLQSIKLFSVKCTFGNSDLDSLEFSKLQSSNLDLRNNV